MSLTEEIHFHWKSLVDADETEKYALGLTETEYHMGKIIDRILIDTGHGRMTIRLKPRTGGKTRWVRYRLLSKKVRDTDL